MREVFDGERFPKEPKGKEGEALLLGGVGFIQTFPQQGSVRDRPLCEEPNDIQGQVGWEPRSMEFIPTAHESGGRCRPVVDVDIRQGTIDFDLQMGTGKRRGETHSMLAQFLAGVGFLEGGHETERMIVDEIGLPGRDVQDEAQAETNILVRGLG
jgi:hypothetical protein